MDPPRGWRTGGDTTRKSGFHPSHRAAHPRLNPTLRGATNLPPSTVQPNLTLSGCPGAVSGAPQPVGQDLRRKAASPHSASFTGGLTYAHTHRPGTSPNTPGSWTPAPPAPFTKQRFTAARQDQNPIPAPPLGPSVGSRGGLQAACGPVRTPRGCRSPRIHQDPLSEGGRIDILSSREETEAQGAHEVAGGQQGAPRPGPGQSSKGTRRAGRGRGHTGRWARGSHSITPTPSQAQGRLSPLTPRHGPGATLGPLPGAAQMAPCPPALHLHEPQLSPSAAPAASGRRSITGPPLPSVRVSSLWGAEWLSQWL